LKLGEVQEFKNLTMVPAVSDYDDGLDYITLGEALSAGSIEIREVSEGGSVPELRVVNRAEKMVLILDGEELAKQNRIVNTTILVAAGVEIVIQIIDTGYTLSPLIHLYDHDSLKIQTTGMP
jgi:hypothetical protein